MRVREQRPPLEIGAQVLAIESVKSGVAAWVCAATMAEGASKAVASVKAKAKAEVKDEGR
jgi:uncharacterized protein YegP (UPF0339 family)